MEGEGGIKLPLKKDGEQMRERERDVGRHVGKRGQIYQKKRKVVPLFKCQPRLILRYSHGRTKQFFYCRTRVYTCVSRAF